jgi:hypothetical protein
MSTTNSQKSVANSVLIAICYELATIGVVANPKFSCSDGVEYPT